MNLNAGETLKPVFDFLDEVIADYGVYLYLVLVWLSLILVAWISERRVAAKIPASPAHSRRYRYRDAATDPATATTSTYHYARI